MKDNKAKDVFMELVEKGGPDFLEIVKCRRCDICPPDKKCKNCNDADHANIVDAEFSYFQERMKMRLPEAPAGYSFGLPEANVDYFMPAGLDLSQGATLKTAEITFAAMGGGFSVRVRETGDFKCNEKHGQFYTITIEKDCKALKCIGSKSKVLAHDPVFNRLCPSDDWIYYRIAIDYADSTITVMHDGPSKQFNNAECKITCRPQGIRTFTYVSFERTSETHKPFIRDFQMSFK